MEKQEKSRLNFGLLLDWVVEKGDTTYYQSKILYGVDEFAKENDINLICFVTGRLDSPLEWEKSRSIIYEFVNKNTIDGLIVVSATLGRITTRERMVELLNNYKDIPLVTISVGYDGIPCSTNNNYGGMKKNIDHLIEVHGCRKIGFITGLANNEESQLRYQAYIDSLKAHDIPFNPDLVHIGDFLYTSGAEAVRIWLDEKNLEFDGIAAADDCMAIGALLELQKRLDKISGMPAIVGFDNVEISNYYSLTTVNQSFSRQAKQAADMILRMIHGKKFGMKEEDECELIIRSSCGCVSNRVKHVFPEDYNSFTESFESAYMLKKELILEELSQINSINVPAHRADLFDFEQRVLDALYTEIHLAQTNRFLSVWNNFISWSKTINITLSLLHDILSSIRKNIMQCVSDKRDIAKVENLFQEARMQLGEVVRNSETSSKIISDFDAESFDFFAEELMANLDYKSQMDSIFSRIKEFGVEKCYISLYENPDNILQYSRLILGFKEDIRYPIESEGIRFNTVELLPQEILKDLKKERTSMLLIPLYQGSNQLGFFLLNYNRKVEKIVELLRFRLSVALKGTFLIEKIRHQAQDLERQVIERTKELVMTNSQLQREISEKKKTEKLLKEALENLKSSNEKLQNMSIKDELTGLYNRRGFWAMGSSYYEKASKYRKSFIMMFADMDGLKQINDKYGHQEGDYAICKIAQALRNSFKKDDIISRLGGDEFTVIAVDSGPEDMGNIINSLNESLEMINSEDNKPYKFAISYGMSYFDPDYPLAFEELIALSDSLLYDQKQQKKQARKEILQQI